MYCRSMFYIFSLLAVFSYYYSIINCVDLKNEKSSLILPKVQQNFQIENQIYNIPTRLGKDKISGILDTINKKVQRYERKDNIIKISYNNIRQNSSSLKGPLISFNNLMNTYTNFNHILIKDLLHAVNLSNIDIFRSYIFESNNNKKFGMINDLTIGYADLGGTPLPLISNITKDLVLLGQIFKVKKKFIFRAAPHSYIGNVFTLPFDTYVWYSCIGLICVIFLIVYLVVYWEWNDPFFKKYIIPRLCLRPHPVDIILMEIGSVAQQGFEVEPRSNSGKVVFIFTLLSLMFLYTSFSASIVALLQTTSEAINSFESLIQSKISIGFQNNVSIDHFENSKNNSYVAFNKPLIVSLDKGVEKLRKEFFAFYADDHEVYEYVNKKFYQQEKCTLREISFNNPYMNYGLFMKKNSKHQETLRKGLFMIMERGIQSRQYNFIFPAKPFCDSVGGNFESVGLSDSYGAFFVMAGGLFLSLFLYVVEYYWNRHQMIKKIKKLINKCLSEI